MQSMIEFKNIDMRFANIHALNNVSFSVNKGEVHALIGENGAGKSTLLNILHGVYQATGGEVMIENELVSFRTPLDALKYGIAKVHQEVQIVDTLNIGQNIVLGFEPSKLPGSGVIDFKSLYKKADALLQELGCSFVSTDSVKGLSVGEMQMIAMAKALFHNAKIVSLDEPTSSLSEKEINALFAVIRKLREQGVTIIYVSHKLDELFTIADRITVLRDGEYIGTFDSHSITRDKLIHYMVGRDVSNYAQRLKESCMTDEVVLSVQDLCGRGFGKISFDLHRGEILGLSGLVGAGRTEIVRAVFGADRSSSGQIVVGDRKMHGSSPRRALLAGIGFLTENRKREGFAPLLSNEANMTLAGLYKFSNKLGLIRRAERRAVFQTYSNRTGLNIKDPNYLTENLSGGNQQKVILAKWLATRASIIIFDEPTKGVDVGAKAEIYSLMEEYVNEGNAILMVSSELTEIMGMCDNVLVIRDGMISAKIARNDFEEELILKYAMPEG